MANVTIPDLTGLGANVAAGDLLEIADISNSDASRKVTQLQLVQGLTITPTTSGVLTIANSKTLTASNTLTLAGTDGTVMTFPSTSATIARTDAANTFTGVQTMTSPSFATSVVTGSTTLAVFNTTATTVNAFGVATTLNIGAGAATVLNLGGHTSAAELRFLEPSGSGTNYSGFKQAALAASITYGLPTDAPVNGDVLTAQSDGTLSWEPQSGAANAVTLASAAAGAGLFIVSAGADRTATATDTVDTINATNANATTFVLGGVTITATGTELNFTDGVTSAIQTQLNAKANLAGGNTFTGAQVFPSGQALIAPVLGTPTSGTLTNCTAYPTTVKITSGNYTIGTTSAQELWGGVIYVTGAATITIPAVAAGQSFTVITIGAVAVSVDPNASDLIYLDGTALADGDKITNLSTAGDIAVFTAYDATGWYAATNGWTDTN